MEGNLSLGLWRGALAAFQPTAETNWFRLDFVGRVASRLVVWTRSVLWEIVKKDVFIFIVPRRYCRWMKVGRWGLYRFKEQKHPPTTWEEERRRAEGIPLNGRGNNRLDMMRLVTGWYLKGSRQLRWMKLSINGAHTNVDTRRPGVASFPPFSLLLMHITRKDFHSGRSNRKFETSTLLFGIIQKLWGMSSNHTGGSLSLSTKPIESIKCLCAFPLSHKL